MKKYCSQNSGDCFTCSLRNYGRDCRNVALVAEENFKQTRGIDKDLQADNMRFSLVVSNNGFGYGVRVEYGDNGSESLHDLTSETFEGAFKNASKYMKTVLSSMRKRERRLK